MKNVKYRLLENKDKIHDSTDVYEDIELHAITHTQEGESHTENDNETEKESVGFSHVSCSCLSHVKGYIYAMLSCLVFSTGSVFVKALHGKMSPFEIVAFRSAVQLSCCFAVVFHKRISIWTDHTLQTRTLLMIRGILGGGGILFYFYAFQNLPIGDAASIIYSSPMYIAILAWIFLGEAFGIVESLTLLLGFTGVLLVARPTFLFHAIPLQLNVSNISAIYHTNTTAFMQSNETEIFRNKQYHQSNVQLGIICAFLGSVTSSISFVILRKIPKVHFIVSVFYVSFWGIIIASIVMLATRDYAFPSAIQPWLFALVVGLCGIIGQIFLTKAFQIENAGPVSIVRQLDIVFTYIFQVAVFHNQPSVLSFVGSTLVISGTVILGIKKSVLVCKK